MEPGEPAALRRRLRPVARSEAVRPAARRVLPLRRVRPAARDRLHRRRGDVGLHRVLAERPHLYLKPADLELPLPVLPQPGGDEQGRRRDAHDPRHRGSRDAVELHRRRPERQLPRCDDRVHRRQRPHLRRPRQRLDGRRLRQGRHLRRLGQRPAERRRHADDERVAQRPAGDALHVRGSCVRRRRRRHPDRQHRRRSPDRLGRRVEQLSRAVRAVRDRDGQPPGQPVPARVPVRALCERRRRPDARHRHRQPHHPARPERRVRGRARADHPAGSPVLAAADRRPERPAAGEHPRRSPRHAPRRGLQQRLDERVRRRLRRLGALQRHSSASRQPRSVRTRRASSTPTTRCRSTTRSRR